MYYLVMFKINFRENWFTYLIDFTIFCPVVYNWKRRQFGITITPV